LTLLQDEYADSRVLDDYRKRRVEQLKQMALKNKFGRVGHGERALAAVAVNSCSGSEGGAWQPSR